MPEPSGHAATLPGIDQDLARAFEAGAVERAAAAQLDELRTAGRLTNDHGVLVAMILNLARTQDRSTGKIAGVQAAAQLERLLERLPKIAETSSSEWDELVKALAGDLIEQ